MRNPDEEPASVVPSYVLRSTFHALRRSRYSIAASAALYRTLPPTIV